MDSRDEAGAKLAKAIEDFLRAAGVSMAGDPHLLDTPVRAADMWLDDLLDGYRYDPAAILSQGLPAAPNHGLVVATGLFFHSVCPHHLLPSQGTAHIAYVPGDTIVGFSRLVRLLDCLSHRLVLQETVAKQVCGALMEHLGARGAACLIEAEQSCMVLRGVRRPGSKVVVSEYTGVLADDSALRAEFLQAVGKAEPPGAESDALR